MNDIIDAIQEYTSIELETIQQAINKELVERNKEIRKLAGW